MMPHLSAQGAHRLPPRRWRDRGRHPPPPYRPLRGLPHGHHGREPRHRVRGVARGAGRVRPCAPGARRAAIDAGASSRRSRRSRSTRAARHMARHGRVPAETCPSRSASSVRRSRKVGIGDGRQRLRHQRRRGGARADERGQGAGLGRPPRLRLVARAEAGVEPAIMGIGPIPAIRRCWRKPDDDRRHGRVELNEAFASVAAACIERARAPGRTRSTRTAARSLSATRSAPRAPS